MRKTFNFISIFLISLSFFGCEGNPPIKDYMLDGNIVFDPALNNPEKFLVSAKYPNPTQDDLNRHIIIAGHGYSATTFEWSEFQEWSKDSTYRVSQLLLDGHGTSYSDFKASKWEDWLKALKKEYVSLEKMGYQNISYVCSSTSGALILELVNSNFFDDHIKPKNIFLIDPIIVPSSKLQSIAGIVGPMLVYIETDQDKESDKYWYHFRPQETINELNELIVRVRGELEDGFRLPKGTYMKVFHSKNDPVANSLSTVLIFKGIKKHNGKNIDIQILNSDIHVFTRLKLRNTISKLNRKNQETAFKQMADRLN